MLLRHVAHADTDTWACSHAVLHSSDVLCFVQAQTDTAVLSEEFACTRDTVLAGTNPTACPASCIRFLNMVSAQCRAGDISPWLRTAANRLAGPHLPAVDLPTCKLWPLCCCMSDMRGSGDACLNTFLAQQFGWADVLGVSCACRSRRAADTLWPPRAPRGRTLRSTSTSAL
jgi:hypothetical protein